MTERERWVVYPLLFLALGAALRDKLVDPTIRRSIVCQELTVVDDNADLQQGAHVLAKIGHNSEASGTGYLLVNGGVDVAGTLNANQYAIQGHPLTPAFQAMFDFLHWLQAVQQQQQRTMRSGAPPSKSPVANPPAVKSNDDTNGTPSSSKSGDDPAKEN
jgi:hypothetical protein